MDPCPYLSQPTVTISVALSTLARLVSSLVWSRAFSRARRGPARLPAVASGAAKILPFAHTSSCSLLLLFLSLSLSLSDITLIARSTSRRNTYLQRLSGGYWESRRGCRDSLLFAQPRGEWKREVPPCWSPLWARARIWERASGRTKERGRDFAREAALRSKSSRRCGRSRRVAGEETGAMRRRVAVDGREGEASRCRARQEGKFSG